MITQRRVEAGTAVVFTKKSPNPQEGVARGFGDYQEESSLVS
jgi:hypothetical protein